MRKLAVLTGFHEAHTTPVAAYLEERGYPILFDEQDLDVEVYDANGRVLYRDWKQNIEVLRLHEATLRDNGLSWHHPDGPVKTAIAVRSFVEQFPENLLVHDPRACLLFGLWQTYNPKLIFVDIDLDEAMPRLLNYGSTPDYWRYLHTVYMAKIQPRLAHPNALRLSTTDMESGKWQSLVDAHVFGG